MKRTGTVSTTAPHRDGIAAARPAPSAPLRRRWPRRLLTALVVLLLLLAVPGWSLAHVLLAPGTDSTSARIAEWARDHHAGSLVTWLEKRAYTPPKVGGAPAAGSPLAGTAPAGVAPRHRSATGHAGGSLLPPPVSPPASPPVAGEGRWHVLDRVQGRPALAVTYLRPDAVHTSYTSAISWIDPQLLRAVLHPGTQEPGGGGWPLPPRLTGAARSGLVAAFNSAFRLQDSRGGFYGYGRTLRPLRTGAASLVIDRSGGMTVGAWNRDVSMSPSVAVVRQNLSLIVDRGRLVPGLASNTGNRWGATLGNSYYVWRSGIGVTSTGNIVYAVGDRLSAVTLADLLRRAGAVRAMELDINPEWTSFVLYRTTSGQPTERNLLPDMQQPARRYDVSSTRDFVALYAR